MSEPSILNTLDPSGQLQQVADRVVGTVNAKPTRPRASPTKIKTVVEAAIEAIVRDPLSALTIATKAKGRAQLLGRFLEKAEEGLTQALPPATVTPESE